MGQGAHSASLRSTLPLPGLRLLLPPSPCPLPLPLPPPVSREGGGERLIVGAGGVATSFVGRRRGVDLGGEGVDDVVVVVPTVERGTGGAVVVVVNGAIGVVEALLYIVVVESISAGSI